MKIRHGSLTIPSIVLVTLLLNSCASFSLDSKEPEIDYPITVREPNGFASYTQTGENQFKVSALGFQLNDYESSGLSAKDNAYKVNLKNKQFLEKNLDCIWSLSATLVDQGTSVSHQLIQQGTCD